MSAPYPSAQRAEEPQQRGIRIPDEEVVGVEQVEPEVVLGVFSPGVEFFARDRSIVTARPKLEAALAEARKPVSLDSIYTGASGADKIILDLRTSAGLAADGETFDKNGLQALRGAIHRSA